MTARPPSIIVPSRLLVDVEKHDGVFTIGYNSGLTESPWTAAYHFGQADSVYGIGSTATEAFSGMLREAKM